MIKTKVVNWNEATLDTIRVTHSGPPMVARALSILHTCIYNAWVAYDPVATGTRRGNNLRRPSAEHILANKEKAVSHGAYRALVDLYPSEDARFAGLLAA